MIGNGHKPGTITGIVKGQTLGTLFVMNPAPDELGSGMHQAIEARKAGRALQALTSKERAAILLNIADKLLEHQQEILDANGRDLKVCFVFYCCAKTNQIIKTKQQKT